MNPDFSSIGNTSELHEITDYKYAEHVLQTNIIVDYQWINMYSVHLTTISP